MRLIDHDGARLGVVPLAEALARARELGFDLVELSPSQPPLCKILDMREYTPEAMKARHDAEVLREKRVLFVCWHNAARSQMAAAFLARANRYFVVDSAGTHPAASIHPLVIEAMREVGIDLSKAVPAPLTTLSVALAHVVVRCLAPDPNDFAWGDSKARFIDWELPMPRDEAHPTLEEIRILRDAIAARVATLAAELS